MKNIHKILGVLVLSIFAFSCEEQLVVFEGATVTHFTSSAASLGAKTSADTYSIEIGTTTPAAATVQVAVSAKSTAIEGVNFEAFPASVSIGQGEFVTSLTIVPLPENMEVGETVILVIDITNSTVGEDSKSLNQSFTLAITRICPPYPGVWEVVMYDSYGDGWQTNDGNGGDGIQVTLADGTVLEVGLCNPYVESAFDCVPEYVQGTGTITIPEGTETASWYFPGDYWGEISFEIYGPDGTKVWTSPQGAGAGTLGIVHCAP